MAFTMLAMFACAMISSTAFAGETSQTQLPTTLEDFFEPGTQEGTLAEELLPSPNCSVCHQFEDDGNEREVVAPFDNWAGSVMAHAARDPMWHAALAIANQDANMGGDACIRCHSPNAWLGGRSVPTDASGFTYGDFDGVSCNFCHRLVNPVLEQNSPPEDDSILQDLAKEGLLPEDPGNARYVVDPMDARRGPLDDVPQNFHGAPIIVSPFHRSGNLCGTCHDVSNAIYTRQSDGTYVANAYDAAHPTLEPNEMMPEQRTFSEWKNSTFAKGGVYFEDGRFGGDHPTGVMESCQDCHMPKHFGGLCAFWDMEPFFPRPDIAEHSFVGANTWIIPAVRDLYGPDETGLTPEVVQLNHDRTRLMLQNASDIQVQQAGEDLRVRVINFSGHKLPTGYPEGRRMWLNVQYFDGEGSLINEFGRYDFATATLITEDTKVYETKLGIDSAAAAATGLPQGHTFHLMLNNTVLKDNRIPPIGFTNDAFESIRAQPVAHVYQDGQYWDDTLFDVPRGTAEAVVTLYYQTTSREYIEFLRDANTTNSAGQTAYDLWEDHGMSAPVDMDVAAISLIDSMIGDVTLDGIVDIDDLFAVIANWGPCPPPDLCPEDIDGNGMIDIDDLFAVIANWT